MINYKLTDLVHRSPLNLHDESKELERCEVVVLVLVNENEICF